MPAFPLTNPPQKVRVLKVEGKGSDVNLAAHMLWDGFRRDYECAVVVSNDSDLLEPIRIVRRELGIPVGVINPAPKFPALFCSNMHHFSKSFEEDCSQSASSVTQWLTIKGNSINPLPGEHA